MAAPELLTILFSLRLLPCFIGPVLSESPLSPFCPPSSCGELRNIKFPFRLADDPQHCGLPDYELACEANKTVLNFLSGRYYVNNISYEPEKIIRVVDVGLASGSCNLPSQSLTPTSFRNDIRYREINFPWAAFVNCSKRIDSTVYKPVACMSRSSTHVYLVHGDMGYSIQYLQPSCHAVSLIPLAYEADEALTSGAEVGEVLQMGFEMLFDPRGRASKAQIVGICMRYTFRLFFQNIREGQFFRSQFRLEVKFYNCLQSKNFWWENRPRSGPKVDTGYAVALTIFLTALHLVIVILLLSRFVVAPMTVFVYLIKKFQEAHASIDTVEKFLRQQKMLMPARYTYPEIIRITNHFEKKLGQGGFGSVFEGKLPGGYLVAVKMLRDSKFDGEDFISEVSTIGRIHHINIMQLIGFCSEGANRALVYDYMPNGSLDRCIFPPKAMNSSLTWEKLSEIALGIARGIEYLHNGCDMCILHFDIKPHNILLDHNFAPKVSDFGLAKLYPKDYSLASVSAARGTIGYIAPELIGRSFGVISCKSDVYSFGMLLLDMAGARKNIDAATEESSDAYFPRWIYERLINGSARNQVDVNEIGEIERKLCIVGLWCIQMKPPDRPSMSEVIEMLEGSTYALQMPPKPFFSSSPPIHVQGSYPDTSTEELSEILEV